MMTKDEIKAMIAETIKPNNKKAITAQSLANVLTAITNNSGDGGAGLKYSEERMLYGIDGELTDEQRAYNVETYNKAMAGEPISANINGALLEAMTSEGVWFVYVDFFGPVLLFTEFSLLPDGSVEVTDAVNFAIIDLDNLVQAKSDIAYMISTYGFCYELLRILVSYKGTISTVDETKYTFGGTHEMWFNHGNERVRLVHTQEGDIISIESTPLGGGGVELLEIRYKYGEELTDEDKALNAAAVVKMMEGGEDKYIPYISYNGIVTSSIWSAATEGDSMFMVCSAENLSSVSVLEITHTGNVFEYQVSPSQALVINKDMTYIELYEQARLIVDEGVATTPIFVSGSAGKTFYGWVTGMSLTEKGIIVIFLQDTNGALYNVAGSPNVENITMGLHKSGELTLGCSDDNVIAQDAIKLIFGGIMTPDLCTFTIRIDGDGDKTYKPISSEYNYETGCTIVIYRNNAFETWKINKDETSSLVTE